MNTTGDQHQLVGGEGQGDPGQVPEQVRGRDHEAREEQREVPVPLILQVMSS